MVGLVRSGIYPWLLGVAGVLIALPDLNTLGVPINNWHLAAIGLVLAGLVVARRPRALAA